MGTAPTRWPVAALNDSSVAGWVPASTVAGHSCELPHSTRAPAIALRPAARARRGRRVRPAHRDRAGDLARLAEPPRRYALLPPRSYPARGRPRLHRAAVVHR